MKKLLSIFFITCLFLGTSSFDICLAYDVMFNTKTYKYHKIGCRWAQKCTSNCIKIKKEQAQKKGGTPCKVCGG